MSKMPPLSSSNPPTDGFGLNHPKPDPNLITVNVGGQVFQTTKQTLTLAGPDSLLSRVCASDQASDFHAHFIDRDPELFGVLLSLLRTGTLPSKAKAFDVQDLILESKFYGVESILVSSMSNPSQFDSFSLEKSMVLSLNGRDSPTAIATTLFGSLHVAHGGKITSFDWSLKNKSTILTEFAAIDSMLAITPNVVAAGATDFSGLQILDLEKGFAKETLNWENVTRSSSTVLAIGSSEEYLFTSFESGRRNSNTIMVYDLQSLRAVTEIGHNEIFGADLDSAIPAKKLKWISGYNLLLAAGSHSGPSGISGNIKLWDIRSGNVVWEVKEKVDCFSDVAVSENLSGIFKIGANSGEVFYTDLRKLDGENSWVCFRDSTRLINGKKEGVGCRIECHGNQVFCTKKGDIELWTEVVLNSSKKSEDGLRDRTFKRNLVGRVRDMGGDKILNLAFGGNKMFVSRKDQQSIEVWQSPIRGF